MGHGKKIRIWKDPWISKISGFVPERIDLESDAEVYVCELIEGHLELTEVKCHIPRKYSNIDTRRTSWEFKGRGCSNMGL